VVRPADVEALKQLALLGGLDESVELASGEFSNLIEASQQTGSRRLIELTDGGFIQREMGVRKQRIRITQAGRDVLRSEHMLYQRLFEAKDRVHVVGRVKTGLGEGRYYLSRPGYESQFEAMLGWVPYPGTLNLDLGGAEANKIKFLRKHPVFTIEGFHAEGRTFGGVTCHPATIGDVACAAILPHRSHYTTILEIIAPVCLRETLPVDDESAVEVSIQLEAPEA
jgi:riboflavin kinase